MAATPDDRYDEREDERTDPNGWDLRDFLDAVCGASDPWHDLDDEGLVRA